GLPESGCAISPTNSASIILIHLVLPGRFLALPCSVTRERLRRWSVRNPHSTDQLPERMGACSDRLFRQPAVRSRDMYLADPPELQPQLLRRRSVATP